MKKRVYGPGAPLAGQPVDGDAPAPKKEPKPVVEDKVEETVVEEEPKAAEKDHKPKFGSKFK